MNTIGYRLITAIMATYIAGYLIFGIISLFDVPITIEDGGARFRWLSYRAGAMILEHGLALLATSMILAVATLSNQQLDMLLLFKRNIMVVILLIAGIISIVYLLFDPLLYEISSRDEGWYAESDKYSQSESFLAVRPSVRRLAGGVGLESPPPALRPLSADDYLQRALEAAAAADWTTSYWNALQVIRLEPRHPEALEIANRALSFFDVSRLRPAEQSQREFFRQNREAYDELINGNDALVAYTMFWELLSRGERDGDILRYADEARSMSNNVALFTDEINLAKQRPTLGPVSITMTDDTGAITAIYASAATSNGLGVYLFDIEVFIFDSPQTEPRAHIEALWGKLVEGALVIRLVDSDNPGNRLLPTFHRSNSRLGDEQIRYRVPIGLNDEELISVILAQNDHRLLHLGKLVSLALSDGYGARFDTIAVISSLLMRVIFFPTAIIIMICSLLFGGNLARVDPLKYLAAMVGMPLFFLFFRLTISLYWAVVSAIHYTLATYLQNFAAIITAAIILHLFIIVTVFAIVKKRSMSGVLYGEQSPKQGKRVSAKNQMRSAKGRDLSVTSNTSTKPSGYSSVLLSDGASAADFPDAATDSPSSIAFSPEYDGNLNDDSSLESLPVGELPQTDGLPPVDELPQTDGLPPVDELPQTDGLPPVDELPQMDGLPPTGELPPAEDPSSTEPLPPIEDFSLLDALPSADDMLSQDETPYSDGDSQA